MRILEDALNEHFKMQMRSGRPAGRADFSNFLAPLNQIAFFNEHARRVGVPANEVIAVVDLNHVSIGLVVLLGDHYSTGRSKNRRTGLRRKIESGM